VAISKDSSTPPAPTEFTGASSAANTSGSFTPPAGALVVFLAGVAYTFSGGGGTITAADSHGASYTAGPQLFDTDVAFSAVFSHYYSSAPGATTVTATLSDTSAAFGCAIWPYVLDGAAANQSLAASASADSTSGSTITLSITTTVPGSTVLLVASVGDSGLTFTPNAATTTLATWNDTADEVSFVFGQMTAPTVTPGPVTLGWTDGTAADWSLVALEILPSRAAAPPAPQLMPPGFSPMSFTLQPSPPVPALPVTPVSAGDTGSGADSGAAPPAALTGADSGPGADAGTIGVTSTDAGSGTDSASISAEVPGSDTGTGTDAAASIGVTGTDTGTGTDTATAVLGASGSDSGTGADSGAASSAALSGADTGTGTESSAIAATPPVSTDTGSGADTAAVHVSSSDSGTGADAGSQVAFVAPAQVLWDAPDKLSKSGGVMQ
jgi:hypothetical protein